MSAPVRMCSGPSSSMIRVPDAALLPSTPRPVWRENSSMMSGGNPFGNTGNGRSSTMPIISQWPVTESFPGDASAIRPDRRGRRRRRRRTRRCAATRPSPARAASAPAAESCRAMLPSVSLPSSPYVDASGNSPMPTLSSTMTMARSKGAIERLG